MNGIPPVMAELINKCVHEDPSKRCAASEIAKYLEHPHLLDMDFVVPAEGSLAVPVINEEPGSNTAFNVEADDAHSIVLLVHVPIQPVPAEEGKVEVDRKDVATEKATSPGRAVPVAPGSSSVDVVWGETDKRGGQMARIPDPRLVSGPVFSGDTVVSRVAQNLAAAGITVQSCDLQGFCQVLQVSGSLDHFDSTYKRRFSEAVKEIKTRVAESDYEEGILKAEYKQLEKKWNSFDDDNDDDNDDDDDDENVVSDQKLAEHQGAEDGLWGNMVKKMRKVTTNTAQSAERGKRARLQKKLTRVERRLAWPLFWRDVLLKRGVDVEATVIRHLCAVLKIGKMGTRPISRILKVKGLPSKQDFHAFCLHLKGASSSSNAAQEVSTWEEQDCGKGRNAEDISSIKEALLKAKKKEVRNAKCKRAVFTTISPLLNSSRYSFTPTIFFLLWSLIRDQ
jgi:hypothetical protein